MAAESDNPVYMISVVAQMLSIHPQTLRLYEREGFVKPSRTVGNTRLYSRNDVEQIRAILRLTRDMGVNLAGVDIVLNMKDRVEALQMELNAVWKALEERFGAEVRKDIEKAISSARSEAGDQVIKVKIERED